MRLTEPAAAGPALLPAHRQCRVHADPRGMTAAVDALPDAHGVGEAAAFELHGPPDSLERVRRAAVRVLSAHQGAPGPDAQHPPTRAAEATAVAHPRGRRQWPPSPPRPSRPGRAGRSPSRFNVWPHCTRDIDDPEDRMIGVVGTAIAGCGRRRAGHHRPRRRPRAPGVVPVGTGDRRLPGRSALAVLTLACCRHRPWAACRAQLKQHRARVVFTAQHTRQHRRGRHPRGAGRRRPDGGTLPRRDPLPGGSTGVPAHPGRHR